jgi:hypothetical protein
VVVVNVVEFALGTKAKLIDYHAHQSLGDAQASAENTWRTIGIRLLQRVNDARDLAYLPVSVGLPVTRTALSYGSA